MATLTTTLTQFWSIVSQQLGLNNNASFDQPLITRWVNEGILDVCARVRPNITSSTITLTAGTADYTLATTYLAINELYGTDVTSSVSYHLNRLSPQELMDYRIGTQFLGAPPVRFYALNGANLLMVYPTPQAADTITVYGQARPTMLAASGDTNTDIPAEWQHTVEYYACWKAGLYQNDAASQNGQVFRAMYEAEIVKMRKAMQHLGGRRMSKAVVGNWAGTRRPIGRPDQQGV